MQQAHMPCLALAAPTCSVTPPGSADAIRDEGTREERVLGTMKEGACFGERALLRSEPRFAAVKATTKLRAMSITRLDFEEKFGPLSDLLPDTYAKPDATPDTPPTGVDAPADGTSATREAMLMGAKSGADPALVYELVSSGWGQSFMLDRNAEVMLDQTYEDARAPVRTILKDLGLIQELARSIGTNKVVLV